MQKQREIIKQLTDKQLKYQLLFSQCILFILSVIFSLFLFDTFGDWLLYFHPDPQEIAFYGVSGGILIVLFDLLIMYLFPEKWYDDGGINKRIFQNRSVPDIFLIVLVVSIAEELLFRGVLQNVFGCIAASTLFAVVHIRYLTKPVLFLSVLVTSFYIGWLFELTGNLFVTIATHFTTNFLLAVIIRYQK